MNTQLHILNIHTSHGIDLTYNDKECFVLKTCLRTLYISYSSFSYVPDEARTLKGAEAYQLILEIVCGLHSELVGESEITHQFKKAYRAFSKIPEKNTKLLKLLEKILKDAKEVRTHSLKEIGQQSYASLTRQVITKRIPENLNVLIWGSGQLAEDLVKLLSKRFNVFVSARNEERSNYFHERYGAKTVPWKEFSTYMLFSHIVNTVDKEYLSFAKEILHKWYMLYEKKGLFVDLASPSILAKGLQHSEAMQGLDSIFAIAQKEKKEKVKHIEKAHHHIEILTHKRNHLFDSSASEEYWLEN